jgi:hypothetical protein
VSTRRKNLSTGLTDQQEAFCREYLKDTNSKQAAIRAGYSAHTAHEQGSRLLSHLAVRRFIEALKAEVIRDSVLDAAFVIGTLQEIARDQKKLRPSAAVSACKLLGDYLGIFQPKSDDDGSLKELVDQLESGIQSQTASLPDAINQ